MNLKRLPPDDPREWIRRANSNLNRARAFTADTCLEDSCFDAQQATEKAIKAEPFTSEADLRPNWFLNLAVVHRLASTAVFVCSESTGFSSPNDQAQRRQAALGLPSAAAAGSAKAITCE